MEQQQGGSVIKIRPAEMEIAVPSFTPSVVSSPSNRFIQEVMASYTKDRMVWNFRSPATGLLCSPLAHVVFKINLTCPYLLNRVSQVGPLLGAFDTGFVDHQAHLEVTGDPQVYAATNTVLGGGRAGYGYRPLFAFGEGNAVMNACESKSITINGATFSELNSNLYARSLDECYVPELEQQRAWSTCGGTQNREDSVPLSGHCLGLKNNIRYSAPNQDLQAAGIGANECFVTCDVTGANAAGRGATFNSQGFKPLEGATMDSGLTMRMNNFYSQIVAVTGRPCLNILAENCFQL